jgi:hypothetical protein
VETRCQRICVTPTRNEAWIIKPFLAAAKTWAERIVVADQGSTDGTLEVLRNTPGVDAIINDGASFDENYRQRLLLKHARQIPGKRVLFGLDADETFSANCTQTRDWKRIEEAEPGTILRFRWVNVLPGFKEAWVPENRLACGFVDDGVEHQGRSIHSPRVPNPPGAPVLDINDFVILHFQYLAWDRMKRKHRWYQVWEYLNNLKNRPLDIFRLYNHMYGSWGKAEIISVDPQWFEGYESAGIDFRSLKSEPLTWWDKEVARILCEHGPQRFRKLAIWDQDWNAIARQSGMKDVDLSDPRSISEKFVHHVLMATQKCRSNWAVRGFEKCLRLSGW